MLASDPPVSTEVSLHLACTKTVRSFLCITSALCRTYLMHVYNKCNVCQTQLYESVVVITGCSDGFPIAMFVQRKCLLDKCLQIEHIVDCLAASLQPAHVASCLIMYSTAADTSLQRVMTHGHHM